jgi:CHASE2 domain-containing sensor protein
VSLKTVLESTDTAFLERLFRGRIVFIGETQPFSDRVAVPVNLAAWEPATRESPAIVVHAQSLRTALAQAAPNDTSRPLLMLLLTAAALLVLVRDWRSAAALAALATLGLAVAEVALLRGGIALAPAAVLFALWTAVAMRGVARWRDRAKLPRAASNFPQRP